jgi:mono/diheme cytochrome c family protein
VRRAAVLILFVLFASSCGGGEEGAPLPETVVGTVEQPSATGDPNAGKQVYAASGCGSCHTFGPAGSTGKVGPNLNELPQLAERANEGTLEEFVRTSVTNPDAYVERGFQPGVMPSFNGSEQELANLVAFLTQRQ